MQNVLSKIPGSKQLVRRLKCVGRPKVFCVGCNKTGTTSLKHALRELGVIIGNQPEAERLAAEDWADRRFSRIIGYCRTAEAFQDMPFSLPYTYQALDAAFPGSRFILTLRASSEQWYQSIIRFHSRLWGDGVHPPTAEQLKEAEYGHKGRPWKMNRALFNSPEEEPYRKEDLIRYYEGHNAAVQEYFRHRSGDLLVLNVAEKDAYQRLCHFLGKPLVREEFPWKNRT